MHKQKDKQDNEKNDKNKTNKNTTRKRRRRIIMWNANRNSNKANNVKIVGDKKARTRNIQRQT